MERRRPKRRCRGRVRGYNTLGLLGRPQMLKFFLPGQSTVTTCCQMIHNNQKSTSHIYWIYLVVFNIDTGQLFLYPPHSPLLTYPYLGKKFQAIKAINLLDNQHSPGRLCSQPPVPADNTKDQAFIEDPAKGSRHSTFYDWCCHNYRRAICTANDDYDFPTLEELLSQHSQQQIPPTTATTTAPARVPRKSITARALPPSTAPEIRRTARSRQKTIKAASQDRRAAEKQRILIECLSLSRHQNHTSPLVLHLELFPPLSFRLPRRFSLQYLLKHLIHDVAFTAILFGSPIRMLSHPIMIA
jgi:hypothetical protein